VTTQAELDIAAPGALGLYVARGTAPGPVHAPEGEIGVTGVPGVGRFETIWIAGGVGHVRERTIEMGATTIALDNIATMNVVDPGRSFAAAIIGAFMLLLGAWVATMETLFSIPLFAGGIALIIWNFVNRTHAYLAIGTSDGRRTHIVSKNREFLVRVRDMIREKIDTRNAALTGVINITAARLDTRLDGQSPAPEPARTQAS
jgi:hypothetical protein